MSAAERPDGLEIREHSRSTNATPSPDPDAAVLERVRNGDVRAFEELYRTWVGRVHGLCLRLCGDPARAEDLVQEVFVRVWQKVDTFEGRSRFGTWLYRLAVNRVTDALRSELRRSLVVVEEEAGVEVALPARGAPEAGIDLEAAIQRLPAGARMVFVLHDVQGYGHEEIAEQIGIAVGTSKSQLYRARSLLREMLSR